MRTWSSIINISMVRQTLIIHTVLKGWSNEKVHAKIFWDILLLGQNIKYLNRNRNLFNTIVNLQNFIAVTEYCSTIGWHFKHFRFTCAFLKFKVNGKSFTQFSFILLYFMPHRAFCRLHELLHLLKQSPLLWYMDLESFLPDDMKFWNLVSSHSIFLRLDNNRNVCIALTSSQNLIFILNRL